MKVVPPCLLLCGGKRAEPLRLRGFAVWKELRFKAVFAI